MNDYSFSLNGVEVAALLEAMSAEIDPDMPIEQAREMMETLNDISTIVRLYKHRTNQIRKQLRTTRPMQETLGDLLAEDFDE